MAKRRPFGHVERDRRRIVVAIRYGPKRTREWLPRQLANATAAEKAKWAEQTLATRCLEAATGCGIDPTRTTLGEYLDLWLAGYPEGNTKRNYAEGVRRLSTLAGSVGLQKLTVGHVEQAITKMQMRLPGSLAVEHPPVKRRGASSNLAPAALAPKTVNDTLNVGRAALNTAVKRGLLARNVFALVDRLPLPPSTRRSLTPDEAPRLLAYLLRDPVPGDQADLMLAVLLLEVRRYNELAGLRCQDVGDRSYTVNQTWLAEQQRLEPTSPSDPKHPRKTYTLSDTLASILRRQALARQNDAEQARQEQYRWTEVDLVFTSKTGDPMPRTTLQHTLHRACAACGLPKLALHELRHTGVSLMVYNGADIQQIVAAGGWKDATLPLKVYGHLFEEREREAKDSLAALLLGQRRTG